MWMAGGGFSTRERVDLLVAEPAGHDHDRDREGRGGLAGDRRHERPRPFRPGAGGEHQEGDVLVGLDHLDDLLGLGADPDHLLGVDADGGADLGGGGFELVLGVGGRFGEHRLADADPLEIVRRADGREHQEARPGAGGAAAGEIGGAVAFRRLVDDNHELRPMAGLERPPLAAHEGMDLRRRGHGGGKPRGRQGERAPMIPGTPALSHGSPAANTAMPEPALPTMHATTILMVRKGGRVVIGGDGQVSLGQTIVKGNAQKVRWLAKGAVIGGFAGATADAFTLFERLEAKLEQYPGQLTRACVELTKDWRTDRYLRRLEAMMLVADREVSLLLSGAGDVLEPELSPNGSVMAIGSGGNYALAAARALIETEMEAETIVRRSLAIAAEICVYTNGNVVIESLD